MVLGEKMDLGGQGGTVRKLGVSSTRWDRGYMRINVRREFILKDSIEAVMGLSRKELRKVWRFEFIGEADIDAGGLAREWVLARGRRASHP